MVQFCSLFFLPSTIIIIAFIAVWRSQSELTGVMDGLAEEGAFVGVSGQDVMCGNLPPKGNFRKGGPLH